MYFSSRLRAREDLAELTLPAYFLIAGEVLYKLLGYRRTAAAVAVREERACGSVPVNALMRVETLVLGSYDSVDEALGHVLVVDPDAVLLCGKALYLDKLVILVVAVDEARVLHLDILQVRVVGIIREVQDIHGKHRRNDAHHDDQYQQHCGECRANYGHCMSEILCRAAARLL